MGSFLGGANLLVSLIAGLFSIILGAYFVVDRRAKGRPSSDPTPAGPLPETELAHLPLIRTIVSLDAQEVAIAVSGASATVGVLGSGLLPEGWWSSVALALLFGAPIPGMLAYPIAKVRMLATRLANGGTSPHGDPSAPLDLRLRIEHEASKSASGVAMLLGLVVAAMAGCGLSAAVTALTTSDYGPPLGFCSAIVVGIMLSGIFYPWIKRAMLTKRQR